MWFNFNQNNSGGSFITNDKLCNRLYIEANSKEEAIKIAESLGCYWRGVKLGYDCSCCGDRWYIPFDSLDKEDHFDENLLTIEEYVRDIVKRWGGWTIPEARIFYLNGTVVEVNGE